MEPQALLATLAAAGATSCGDADCTAWPTDMIALRVPPADGRPGAVIGIGIYCATHVADIDLAHRAYRSEIAAADDGHPVLTALADAWPRPLQIIRSRSHLTCTECDWEMPPALHVASRDPARPDNADYVDASLPVAHAHSVATAHPIAYGLTSYRAELSEDGTCWVGVTEDSVDVYRLDRSRQQADAQPRVGAR